LQTFDEKVKYSLGLFNLGLVAISCILLQTPQYTGFTKYFYKLIQSFAFVYFINIFFLVFLVG